MIENQQPLDCMGIPFPDTQGKDGVDRASGYLAPPPPFAPTYSLSPLRRVKA